eukprot:CAMPEP_0182508944 /NCGR_PEP_ID=MMETSP1321-20130603/25914_1 /TAXON_ID=91990 /ORGANISM="Bolidomonas sp., Strain RCC1657" /LENGTH=169 /DNA_ID=CAMNT_0024715105 /DNA_START=31 /DNA_END=541 /DNA_ORIENTATION=+
MVHLEVAKASLLKPDGSGVKSQTISACREKPTADPIRPRAEKSPLVEGVGVEELSSFATSKALLSASELVPTTPPRPMCLQSTAPARTPATLTTEVEGTDRDESAPILNIIETNGEVLLWLNANRLSMNATTSRSGNTPRRNEASSMTMRAGALAESDRLSFVYSFLSH